MSPHLPSPISRDRASGPPAPLTLDHLHAFAAWLTHGPGTVRQIAGKADVDLVTLHPRTAELFAVGALEILGQSASDGPVYCTVATGVHLPSGADVIERQLSTLAIESQVSIAAGIMARHGRRGRIVPATEQEEITLTGSAKETAEAPGAEPIAKSFHLE